MKKNNTILSGLLVLFLVGTPSTMKTACLAPLIIDGLLLTPAAVGSYGTYETLKDENSFIGDSFTRFSRGMSGADVRYPSTQLRALLLNFGKSFKSHEKMAIMGSLIAVWLGVGLTISGCTSSLIRLYKYWKSTEADEAECKAKLRYALNMTATGICSTAVGVASIMLLTDYAGSEGPHREHWRSKIGICDN